MSGLNETPSGERVHIGFFGVRNAGKSSLVNAVTGQDLAVVSDTPGTTTDPVRKAMELLPVGPVLVIDTPGIDDVGDLGGLRVQKALRVLDSVNVAVLVVDSTKGMGEADEALVAAFRDKGVPYAIAWNKSDLPESGRFPEGGPVFGEGGPKWALVSVSAVEGTGVHKLKETVAALAKGEEQQRPLIGDLLKPGDVVVLVIPIDSAAPKGRLILPQQQVIRDILDAGASACATSVEGLRSTLAALVEPPRLVVTDSQVFAKVGAIVPDDIELTSFSILMARYKGTLAAQLEGVQALEKLRDGDEVLIAEGCTHHRQCDDIGTVKMPLWIEGLCGARPRFSFTAGGEYPRDLTGYAAIVHCGGCMLNAREMEHRMNVALEQGVPFTNYGMAIAKATGTFDRSVLPVT